MDDEILSCLKQTKTDLKAENSMTNLEQNPFLFLSYERQKRSRRNKLIASNQEYHDISSSISRRSNKRGYKREASVENTPLVYSAVRSSIKGSIKKLPFVMQNNKAFPRDFFASSPKCNQLSGNNQVPRSAARKDTNSLNRKHKFFEERESKCYDLIPHHEENTNLNKCDIRCRSLLKSSKVRPRSYRVNRKNFLKNRDNNDNSFCTNISMLNQSNIDDSFTSFRNDNNSSKMSKEPRRSIANIPWNNNLDETKKSRKLKFK